MSIKYAYSVNTDSAQSVSDLKNQLNEIDIKLLVVFASPSYDQVSLNIELKNQFPKAVIIGCSTAGEIISGKMLKNSVVAMAFDSQMIADAKVEVIENLKKEVNVKKALNSFESYFNIPMSTMDFTKYVGIVLVDGLSGAEEKIMDKIGDRTDVIFIGGSAGDNLKFTGTYVYAEGKVYTDAAVLLLIKTNVDFGFIKTQSFASLGKKLRATKVGENLRHVLEFNNKPAVVAYAELLGIPSEKLPEYVFANPVGVVTDGEIFVRSPLRVLEDNTIMFACNVLEGSDVEILENKDIIKDTIKAVADKVKEMGSISAIINFNCIFRTLELEQKGLTKEYGEIFSDIPTIGFSTYGEDYIGHINQTATMLVFK